MIFFCLQVWAESLVIGLLFSSSAGFHPPHETPWLPSWSEDLGWAKPLLHFPSAYLKPSLSLFPFKRKRTLLLTRKNFIFYGYLWLILFCFVGKLEAAALYHTVYHSSVHFQSSPSFVLDAAVHFWRSPVRFWQLQRCLLVRADGVNCQP